VINFRQTGLSMDSAARVRGLLKQTAVHCKGLEQCGVSTIGRGFCGFVVMSWYSGFQLQQLYHELA